MLDLIELNSYEFMPIGIQRKKFYQNQVKNFVQKMRIVKNRRTTNTLHRIVEIDIGGHFVISVKIRDDSVNVEIAPMSMSLNQLVDKLVCTDDLIRNNSHEIAKYVLNSALADNMVDLF